MRIVKFQAENIKRLVVVEIAPTGNVVQITGKNGAGKTSVLDAIYWALCGKDNIQSVPIRNGASEARIRLDLGEVIVTRKFTKRESGEVTTSVTVESAEGA
jgi:DNA repair exonuclease SbcCD ATPase subunit